jgi:YbbR domain-containing protein
METYTPNQNPIPQVPMTAEQHHRFINLSLIVVAIALIIAILYWWTVSNNNIRTAPASGQADLRAEIAAILKNSPTQVSQDEIDQVAAQLKQAKTTTVTEAQRQAVANALRAQ